MITGYWVSFSTQIVKGSKKPGGKKRKERGARYYTIHHVELGSLNWGRQLADITRQDVRICASQSLRMAFWAKIILLRKCGYWVTHWPPPRTGLKLLPDHEIRILGVVVAVIGKSRYR